MWTIFFKVIVLEKVVLLRNVHLWRNYFFYVTYKFWIKIKVVKNYSCLGAIVRNVITSLSSVHVRQSQINSVRRVVNIVIFFLALLLSKTKVREMSMEIWCVQQGVRNSYHFIIRRDFKKSLQNSFLEVIY